MVTAQVLAQRFVQRWDVNARQLDDGSYVCVHEQLNVGHLFAHLRGEIPWAHICSTRAANSRCFAALRT